MLTDKNILRLELIILAITIPVYTFLKIQGWL